MKRKIILDLCGGTGSWSKPYKDAGYDVRLVTLPDKDVRTYVPPKNVHGVLAAPPCTEFSRGLHTRNRDIISGLSVVSTCLFIIASVRPKWFCIENPKGLLRTLLGEPDGKFEHWEFGHNVVKPTYLWGKFNMPKRTVTIRPFIPTVGKGTSKEYANPRVPAEYRGMGLNRAALRAITPAGLAHAFYEANP